MISTLVSNGSNSQSGGRYLNSFLKEALLKEKTLGLCSISLAAEELALSIVAFLYIFTFQGSIFRFKLSHPTVYELFQAFSS